MRDESSINPVDFVQTIGSLSPNSERFSTGTSPRKDSEKEKKTTEEPEKMEKKMMMEEDFG